MALYNFFSLWIKGDLRLYFELIEKSYRGRHHSEKYPNHEIIYMDVPPLTPGVPKEVPITTKQAR